MANEGGWQERQGRPGAERTGAWLAAARIYLAVMAVGNLRWDVAQLPLYTMWCDGTRSHILFALMHATVGDLFITAAVLTTALAVFGDSGWPHEAFLRVTIATVLFRLAYTVYSEWMNVEVRHTLAYPELMPRVPPLDTGLSPLLQWIVVPILAFLVARRLSGPVRQ